jgi:hypothetical protein
MEAFVVDQVKRSKCILNQIKRTGVVCTASPEKCQPPVVIRRAWIRRLIRNNLALFVEFHLGRRRMWLKLKNNAGKVG